MKGNEITLEKIREIKKGNNLKNENLYKEIRDEIITFLNQESEYTKNHSLFLANEIISIIINKL